MSIYPQIFIHLFIIILIDKIMFEADNTVYIAMVSHFVLLCEWLCLLSGLFMYHIIHL